VGEGPPAGARGVKPPHPYILRVSVDEYIQEGYRWFVFDMVDVGPELSSVDAVSYRFETPKLFYPLKISRTGRGHTDIMLYVLTTWNESYLFVPGFRRSSLRDTVMPELDALFNEDSPVYFSVWHIKGDLSTFHL
jgi:hypothetical protein